MPSAPAVPVSHCGTHSTEAPSFNRRSPREGCVGLEVEVDSLRESKRDSEKATRDHDTLKREVSIQGQAAQSPGGLLEGSTPVHVP